MSDKKFYYVQKEGVYSQGIFCVTEDLEHAKLCAKLYASEDEDDYHAWKVFLFEKPVKSIAGSCDMETKVWTWMCDEIAEYKKGSEKECQGESCDE